METAAQHKVGAAEGERADFPRLGNRYVFRGEDAEGRFALIEHTIPPRALAAPIHVHEHEDEYSFASSRATWVPRSATTSSKRVPATSC